MPAVQALQERFNFTSHAESPPLFYIHFFILRADVFILNEGETIVMPKDVPHAVFGEEKFKMELVVSF